MFAALANSNCVLIKRVLLGCLNITGVLAVQAEIKMTAGKCPVYTGQEVKENSVLCH